jgi:membrane associated rhomboid family serine protease
MIPLRDSVPSRTTPVVTRALVVINAAVFLFELALGPKGREHLIYLFGVVPARFTHPSWAAWVGFPVDNYWPLLTHQFLHGGWLHLISNMWALWIFGDNVEDRMGHGRFALFYLLCGAVAGLAQLLSEPNSTVPALGASGAIAGVLGAYLMLYPTARVLVLFPVFILPLFFEVPAVFYLGLWFFSQLFSGTLALASSGHMQGIAWWAHVGGFLAGMGMCKVFVRQPPRRVADRSEVENEWRR